MPGLAASQLPDSVLWRARLADCVTDIALSVDGRHLAAATAAGSLEVLDSRDGRRVLELPGHVHGALQITWAADGRRLASAGQDGQVRLWDLATGDVLHELDAGGAWVERLSWAPDGCHLAAAAGRVLRVWDNSCDRVLEWSEHASTVTALHWRSDSTGLLTACYQGVHLHALSGQRQHLPCASSVITAAWSPNGQFVCAGSQDRVVHFWDFKREKPTHLAMRGYPAKVAALAWSPDSQSLATAGGAGVVVWRTRGRGPAGTRPQELTVSQARLTALAWHARGKWLACGAADGTVCVWDMTASPVRLMRRVMMDYDVTCMQWLSDGTLITADRAGNLRADEQPR